MAKGTDFGGVHSSADLKLIQQKVEIQPATPKLNLVDVPGADGSKDLSDRPAGRIVYNDRTITWTFAVRPNVPTSEWHSEHRKVSNALNGRRCRITLDDDPNYYYEGRLSVNKYNVDKVLRQITVEAICSPYMLRHELTVERFELTTEETLFTIENKFKPVIPTIELTAETTITWGDLTVTLPAGTHQLLSIELQAGENVLGARVTSGTGTMTITYQEGSL